MARQEQRIQVAFRLDQGLVARLRNHVEKAKRAWPPGPSQTEIAERGIAMVLDQLERGAAKDYGRTKV